MKIVDPIGLELESIRRSHHGVLRASDVVEYARDKKTALHDRFEWGNRKAAEEYRLWQAREIIRVSVTVLQNDEDPIRAYVSLIEDRKEVSGGYRLLDDVLRNKVLRAKLLAQALAEFNTLRRKYTQLTELAKVFQALDEVQTTKKKVAAGG